MMLAAFSLAGMVHIHEMNALKTLLGVAINGLALAHLRRQRHRRVAVRGLVMIAGSIVGGYFGAALARTIDPRWIRVLVIVIGWTMTIYFFVR